MNKSISHMHAALPGFGQTVIGTLGWTILMAASAALALLIGGRLGTVQGETIILIFALGGALAFPTALYATRLFALGTGVERRYAAALLFLGLATMLGTAFVFSMHYRLYFSQWHENFLTITWVFQLLFTGANAVYQFAVLGTRLFFPFGFFALFAVSLWVARQAR